MRPALLLCSGFKFSRICSSVFRYVHNQKLGRLSRHSAIHVRLRHRLHWNVRAVLYIEKPDELTG